MCAFPGLWNVIQMPYSTTVVSELLRSLCQYINVLSLPTTHLTALKSRSKWRTIVDYVWNVMAHAQKPHFVVRAKRTNPFKSAEGVSSVDYWPAEVCASAVVMLDTPCSEVVWRVLATHSIRQFPFHFPSCASPCAFTFQLDSNNCKTIPHEHRALPILQTCYIHPPPPFKKQQ